jgi:GNAT superfamily N-acetyltransferase
MSAGPVKIKGAPSIDGLSFRRIRGEPDFRVLADVIQKSRDADHYEIVDTPRDLERDFRYLQNCDPSKDMIYVEVNGKLVGFCRCEWRSREGGERTYELVAHLLPEWRIKDLRRAMVRENERRLRTIAHGHPDGFKKFLEVRSNFSDNPWRSLIEEEGYRPYRHSLQMVRPVSGEIPNIPLPKGLDVRPYKTEQLRQIFFAAKEAFREEPNFSEEWWTDDAMKHMTERRSFRPELWVVAWEGDEVAGGVMNVIDEEENKKFGRNWGDLAAVFVRRPYRRQGLAAALMARSLHVLRTEGVTKASLGVDSENPTGARRIYEKLGFREYDHYASFRKPLHPQ